MAHHLHNMLFLLGPRIDRSEEPAVVTARTARVNDIETFDTVAAKVRTAGGADLLFLASHAIAEDETVEPRFVLELEDGTVNFPGESASMVAQHRDGSVVEYASPNATPQVDKLWQCVAAVPSDGARPEHPAGGEGIPCGLETSRPHVACVEAIEESGIDPHIFPDDIVRVAETEGGRLRWVEGLAAALEAGYATGEWPDLPGQG